MTIANRKSREHESYLRMAAISIRLSPEKKEDGQKRTRSIAYKI